MTEQRFQVTDNTDNPFLCDWSVTDYANGAIVHHPMTSENMANVMCDLLNALNDENEQLILTNNGLLGDIEHFKKENEQLKKQLNRLYNYFEDWYSEMTSANDFSEIWDNVKEDERWGDVE